MLLVIPSIEIKKGKCARNVQGIGINTYSDDPIEIAKLWRKENAKSLHITDVDGAIRGYPVNFDIVKQIVRTVDIPIELGGGLRQYDEVRKVLSSGIFRVVIGTMLVENPDEAKQALDKFSSSKIVIGIDASNYRVSIKGRGEDAGLTPLSVALNAKQLGFHRLLYTDVVVDGTIRKPNFQAINSLVEKTRMKVTVSGGISGLEDLLKLQELESLGIDSVIIGKALYENKFSCQALWRLCEAGDFPYTARV